MTLGMLIRDRKHYRCTGRGGILSLTTQSNNHGSNPMYATVSYVLYIIISLSMTIWVGRMLFKNGRIFLVDAFHQNEAMADAVNHLLIVGFYLLNIGFVSLFLRWGTKPEGGVESIEYISTKIGVVLLVLGIVHYFNMFNIAKMRRKARRSKAQAFAATPEVAADMI